MALLTPRSSGLGSPSFSHWDGPRSAPLTQPRTRRRSEHSGKHLSQLTSRSDSVASRLSRASSSAQRLDVAPHVHTMLQDAGLMNFNTPSTSARTGYSGPTLNTASAFSTGSGGSFATAGNGGSGGEDGDRDASPNGGSADDHSGQGANGGEGSANGGSGDGNGAGDAAGNARKANPLVDLIDTEAAYVSELSKIIRVSARALARGFRGAQGCCWV